MGALTSVGRLHEILAGDEGVTVLDVRWNLDGPPGRDSYEQGHVPGAVFVDLDAELAGPAGATGRHPLPDPDAFGKAMRAAGVSRYRPVVVYDQRDGSAAARAWWLLVHHGHDSVRVLDGGFDAWAEAGLSVETGPPPAVRAGDFVARPGRLPTLDADRALEVATSGLLIDVRSGERFRGEHEPVDPVAGHIPGAVSAPSTGHTSADGSFASEGQLREHFANLGAHGAKEIGVYCGSGVVAAQGVLALREAGFDAALYPGSWSEWVADPDRPVATGD